MCKRIVFVAFFLALSAQGLLAATPPPRPPPTFTCPKLACNAEPECQLRSASSGDPTQYFPAGNKCPKVCTDKPAETVKKYGASKGWQYTKARGERLPELNSNAPFGTDALQRFRRHALQTADCFQGTVANCNNPQKHGFGVLRHIYKTAFDKNPRPLASDYEKRVASRSKWIGGPWSWCGIYVFAMLRTAVSSCKAAFCNDPAVQAIGGIYWGSPVPRGLGPQYAVVGCHMDGAKYKKARPSLAPGDVVVFTGALQHHALVVDISEDSVYTYDGNVYCEGIYPNVRKLSEVQGYYSLTNAGKLDGKTIEYGSLVAGAKPACKGGATASTNKPRAGPSPAAAGPVSRTTAAILNGNEKPRGRSTHKPKPTWRGRRSRQ